MLVRSVGAGIALAAVAGSGFAVAADFGRYQTEDRFGDWQVLCDSEDDMAAITYFDCVVRSATEPAVLVSSLADGPAVSLANGVGSGRLELGEQTVVFESCPEGLCPLAVTVEEAMALLPGATVTVEDGTATLSGNGLGDAVDLALRLPN